MIYNLVGKPSNIDFELKNTKINSSVLLYACCFVFSAAGGRCLHSVPDDIACLRTSITNLSLFCASRVSVRNFQR